MANPWDATFDQVRFKYSPGCVYDRTLQTLPAALDEAERQLVTRFPASYRAFMQRFGPGTLEHRFHLCYPANPPEYRKSIPDHTQHLRDYFGQDIVDYLGNSAWLCELVYFAHDGLGDAYAWHPLEVTSTEPFECRFYHLERAQEATPEVAGESFADFLRWAATRGAEYETDEGEPTDGFRFSPEPLRIRTKPKYSDVQKWLFFNNRTARPCPFDSRRGARGGIPHPRGRASGSGLHERGPARRVPHW